MKISTEKYDYTLTCSKRNTYQLTLGFKTIDFTFCQLLAFRKKILYYSSYQSLETILNGDNFILIWAADNKHLLMLDVPQIIELHNLISLTFQKENSIS